VRYVTLYLSPLTFLIIFNNGFVIFGNFLIMKHIFCKDTEKI
jgi:hypothetical protein